MYRFVAFKSIGYPIYLLIDTIHRLMQVKQSISYVGHNSSPFGVLVGVLPAQFHQLHYSSHYRTQEHGDDGGQRYPFSGAPACRV